MAARSDSASARDLRALPKAHLHLHLEGAMRPATLHELAAEHGIGVPEVQGFGSFAAFAGQYVAACAVLRRPDDLHRLVREVAEDAAAAGAIWVEPALYLPRHRAVYGSDEAVLEQALATARAAEAATGVGVGLMLAADRTEAPAEALGLAHLAARYAGRGVVAFGLANDEVGYPPEPFATAFAVARAAGLISAPHAGELLGPESVRATLDALGPHRIQHGVRAIEDPRLVERLANEQVCLDVCPTSNLLLSIYPSLEAHPLPALLAAGVPISLNGDDPLFFDSGLLGEYELARAGLGLDDVALARIAASSLRASGAPAATVAGGLAGVERWLAT